MSHSLVWPAIPAPGPAGSFAAAAADTTWAVGDLTLPSMAGGTVELGGLLAPRLTVLAVWGTWCAPCVERMPVLAEFHRKWEPRGVEVVSIATEDRDTSAVRDWIDRFDLSFPVLLAPDHDRLMKRLPHGTVPRAYFVTPDGRAVEKESLIPDLGFLERDVERVLARLEDAGGSGIW